jgi:predicted anti-sigma-YlaC factor YlaD
MGCDECREAVSARLDGEPEPVPAAWTDRHLADCADCRDWRRRAEAQARALRVRSAPPVPDLAAKVLAAAWPSASTPPPTPQRRWRVALAAVAAVQVALGLAQLAGWHAGMLAGGGMSTHLFDETTAWNLALGVGMAWVAWRSRAALGLLPVFGGFLLLLTGFCVRDAMAGEVTGLRLAEHGLLLIGFSLMLVVHRDGREPTPAPGRQPVPTPTAEPAGPEPWVPDREPATGGTAPRLRPVNHRRAA